MLLQNDIILEVKDLKMYFPILRGVLRRKVAEVKAVDGVSFNVKRGETLGLVGESGCGKTTTGRCVLRLYEPTSGQIFFKRQDITHLPERKLRLPRREMGAIFQDPFSSLDPRQTAGSIIGEALKIHHMVRNVREYEEKVAELMRLVKLDPNAANRVPHEFSGGQRQRIGIARGLACNPSLVICDEPISSLDVSIQAQIINLLGELQGELGLTYLFIAHDLSVTQHVSDRIAVMYLGRIVEITDSIEIYRNPMHPYTKSLLSAVPIADPFVEEERKPIILKGEVPSPVNPPSGCHFHPRCELAIEDCKHIIPPLREVSAGHEVSCIRV